MRTTLQSLNAPVLSQSFLNHLKTGERIAVAVSGGGDSTALLKLLHQTYGPQRLVAFHFNHNLRAEADADQAWVEQFCTAHHIPCVVGLWETPADTNKQQAARRARYAFFTDMVKKMNLAGVCIGHTKDDIAETLLMRLGRGSGVQGLAGMQTIGTLGYLNVFRPLLETTRVELRTYLEENSQNWLEDSSNTDATYLRPRVRAGIATLADLGLPARALADAAASIHRANIALNHITDAFMQDFTSHNAATQEVHIAPHLLDQPDEIAQRALEKVILTLKPAPLAPRVSKRLRLINGFKNGEYTATLGGVKFAYTGDEILCTMAPALHANAGQKAVNLLEI